MKIIPGELFLLHEWFVIEESLSVIRHDLRNRLGAIRNASFYVRRRLQKLAPDVGTSDPRVPEFLTLIPTEIDAAEQIMKSRLPEPEHGELVAASAIIQRARELVALPSNVSAIVEATSNAHVRVARDEATLAVCCLIENAVDAMVETNGTIRLRVAVRDGQVVLEVEDDAGGGLPDRALEPFFTTRSGRMGIGLNIARRVASRWKGKLALARQGRGTRAELIFGIEG
jgi:signal transduction histidine kinase